MVPTDYSHSPRRARQARRNRRRHPLRAALLLLLALACAAFAALRWGLPLWQRILPPGGGVPAQSAPAWDGEVDLMMLVNATHPLPEGYSVELTELSNGQSVATLIYPALQQMFDDARAQGIYPIVASGYRTPEKQQSLMDEKIDELVGEGYSRSDAEQEALKWVNRVGYSEHQTGLAVDINADGIHSAGYEVYDWLAQNAWRYGFILRYPEDKTDITGTGYEPWHYRYVGVENAKAVTESGLCLEEYLGAA